MEGGRRGESGLYVTLSETIEEVKAVGESHGGLQQALLEALRCSSLWRQMSSPLMTSSGTTASRISAMR